MHFVSVLERALKPSRLISSPSPIRPLPDSIDASKVKNPTVKAVFLQAVRAWVIGCYGALPEYAGLNIA